MHAVFQPLRQTQVLSCSPAIDTLPSHLRPATNATVYCVIPHTDTLAANSKDIQTQKLAARYENRCGDSGYFLGSSRPS